MSVGTPIDRIEGRLKVTGGADYASDRILDGMLYGVPVGSTIAAGRVLRVEHRAPLSSDDVQYYGQYVALVIAHTLESATEGAALVRVTYAPGAVHNAPITPDEGERNVGSHRGDPDKAFVQCPKMRSRRHAVAHDIGVAATGFVDERTALHGEHVLAMIEQHAYRQALVLPQLLRRGAGKAQPRSHFAVDDLGRNRAD